MRRVDTTKWLLSRGDLYFEKPRHDYHYIGHQDVFLFSNIVLLIVDYNGEFCQNIKNIIWKVIVFLREIVFSPSECIVHHYCNRVSSISRISPMNIRDESNSIPFLTIKWWSENGEKKKYKIGEPYCIEPIIEHAGWFSKEHKKGTGTGIGVCTPPYFLNGWPSLWVAILDGAARREHGLFKWELQSMANQWELRECDVSKDKLM